MCRLRRNTNPMRTRLAAFQNGGHTARFGDIGRQIDTPVSAARTICGSLPVLPNLALDCVKARMFMELESPELIPEQEQAVNLTMSCRTTAPS